MNTIKTKWRHCLKTVSLQARIGVLLAGIFRSAVSFGGTIYYYVGASNVWNTAQAYSLTSGGEGGAGIPGQEDSIRIAKDQVVYLDDTSIGFLNEVKEVDFREEGSVVYIHLDNDFSLNCWFGDLGSRVSGAVDIVKTGVGKLTFAKCGTTAHATTADCYNYNIGLDIREGSIQLEPTYASNYRHHYKDVKISSGATLFGVTNGITCVWTLSGEGTVTNLGSSAELWTNKSLDTPTVFSGVLSGYALFSPAGHTYYTGTDSTIGGSLFQPFNYKGTGDCGIIGFMTFAGSADSPSSLGRGNIWAKNGSFYMLYLGNTGETISRSVMLQNTVAAPATFDAGAYGGLVFTGKFEPRDIVYKQQRLELTGSNTVVSVLSNEFKRIASNGTNCSFYVTKSGRGSWRFAENENRKLTGAIAVKDGTLEFDSIYEAGLPSSLGYATDLYEDKCDYPANLDRVPYAYLLGGSGTTGVLRYIGTDSQVVTTRPIALNGAGRFEAPNCDVMKWSGVTAAGEGENSLAIWCAEGQTNHFANITNGTGVVSVAKDGPGDLVLTGELSFGGDLSVSGGGTLTVRDVSNALYRYYKLTFKETVYSSPDYPGYKVSYDTYSGGRGSRTVALNEFALYNAAGTRQNIYASQNWSVADNCNAAMTASAAQLAPGRIAMESAGLLVYQGTSDGGFSHPWRLVDNTDTRGIVFQTRWIDSNRAIFYNDPSSWISVVVRLRDEDAEIAKYDLNLVSYAGGDNFGQTPTAFSISASADGINYEELVATNGLNHTQTGPWTWLSNGASYPEGRPSQASNAPLLLPSSRVQASYNVLNNVRSVSVAAGSTLKFEGATAPVVSALSVDAAGMGSIDGFSFGTGGVLSVQGMPQGATSVAIPADFKNAAGLANVKGWSVAIDGVVTRGFRVASVSPTSIKVCKRGFLVLFR